MVEDRPILSAGYRLPLLTKTDPPCSAVSAIAELLVVTMYDWWLYSQRFFEYEFVREPLLSKAII